MHITILGASGRVGQHVLRLALEDGHRVKALARSPEKLAGMSHDRLSVIQGNAVCEKDLKAALEGSEAVVSALSTDGGTALSDSFPLIVRLMEERGIKRLVTVGTAGILQSRLEPGKLRYQSAESRRSLTRAAEEHHAVLRLLESSALDWTIVCPTYLPDEPPRGEYRTMRDYLPEGGSRISVADTADFVRRQLESREFVRARVGIAY
ncbi:NAD(P)-dependent oxidoreductase [Paenibacillus thailandensis]|uniref:NAD(P)-dependent oxidoreductase n=1 Tax=Paenibacillus thailandensis TaxID=393250 RepID=A0ABW5QVX6_9BACL